MHIALLVTNTDRSAFAARHPRDAEKFARLLGGVRPGWRLTAFDLPAGEVPRGRFDGLLIGGSPASVNEPAGWRDGLFATIRGAAADGLPMAGVCYGHQAIAAALGGRVAANPGGWVLGCVETRFDRAAPWIDGPAVVLAAAHAEQVAALPPGAEVLGHSPGCPVAAYRIGTGVFAIQHHPEITLGFLAALVEELAPGLPDGVVARARASLSQGPEGPRLAEWLARFFEQAQDKAASRSIAVT